MKTAEGKEFTIYRELGKQFPRIKECGDQYDRDYIFLVIPRKHQPLLQKVEQGHKELLYGEELGRQFFFVDDKRFRPQNFPEVGDKLALINIHTWEITLTSIVTCV